MRIISGMLHEVKKRTLRHVSHRGSFVETLNVVVISLICYMLFWRIAM